MNLTKYQTSKTAMSV